jgi:sugar-specific transcriptional regulator TrmB
VGHKLHKLLIEKNVFVGRVTTDTKKETLETYFGFTSLQSKVYLTLLKLGTSKPGRIASITGMVRPEVYRILRDLELKGVVQRSASLPLTYAAISPREALSLVIDQHKERLLDMEQSKGNLVDYLESTLTEEPIPAEERLNVITGAENVRLLTRQMIEKARHEYVAITDKDSLKRFKQEFMHTIISAKRRRLQIRLITEIDSSNAIIARAISRHIELRRATDILLYVDIFDRKKMLFGPVVTHADLMSHDRGIGLWTNNAKFVQGMHAMFERLWKISNVYYTTTEIV